MWWSKNEPQNKNVKKPTYAQAEKMTYGREVASFNQALKRSRVQALDYTPESTGEVVTSQADDFMNVVMDSDYDVFVEANVNEPASFETPDAIQEVTTAKTETVAPTTTTTAKSKTPYVLGALGILAYLGMKD